MTRVRALSVKSHLSIVCWAVLLAACSDPQFEGDRPSADGGTRDDAGKVLDWKEALSGSYVVRARYFGRTVGELGRISSEVVWLARIAPERDGNLVMRTRVCRGLGILDIGVRVFSRPAHPESLPHGELTVVEQDGVLRTIGAPILVGFTNELPSECQASANAPARPEQVWIPGGQCECPSAQTPPTSPDDCRITDPDRDGHPGVTTEISGGATGEGYVRFVDTSQFNDIQVRADGRHVATYHRAEDLFQLACTSRPCTGLGTSVCRPQANAVFVPIEDPRADGTEWSCAEALAGLDSGSLLPPDPLSPSPDC